MRIRLLFLLFALACTDSQGPVLAGEYQLVFGLPRQLGPKLTLVSGSLQLGPDGKFQQVFNYIDQAGNELPRIYTGSVSKRGNEIELRAGVYQHRLRIQADTLVTTARTLPGPNLAVLYLYKYVRF